MNNMRLPQNILEQPGILPIYHALDGKARLVGGVVRDAICGVKAADIDFATPLSPSQIIQNLQMAHIKAIPTGLKHGTITAIYNHKPFEITTLRRDIETNGRHAKIAFTTDWQEDAARRDFTMNALYSDVETGEIYDYFGGLDDLNAKKIRFIGNPYQRIDEDHLRILRYFRFLTRFHQPLIDEPSFIACAAKAASLKSLSRERIAHEIIKIAQAKNPTFVIRKMIEANIFEQIIREIDPSAPLILHRLIGNERTLNIKKNRAVRRLTALLPKNPKTAQQILVSLKMSRQWQADIKARLAIPSPSAKSIRTDAYHHGYDAAIDAALIHSIKDTELNAIWEKLNGWHIPAFPVKGRDLIAAGYPPGPSISAQLKILEEQWIKSNFPQNVEIPVTKQR